MRKLNLQSQTGKLDLEQVKNLPKVTFPVMNKKIVLIRKPLPIEDLRSETPIILKFPMRNY